MKQWTFALHGAQIGLNIPFVPSVLGMMVGGAVGAVADDLAKKKQQAKLRRASSQKAAAGAGVVDEGEKVITATVFSNYNLELNVHSTSKTSK